MHAGESDVTANKMLEMPGGVLKMLRLGYTIKPRGQTLTCSSLNFIKLCH